MKIYLIVILFAFFTLLSCVVSGQNFNHPTINNLDVSYKESSVQTDTVKKVMLKSIVSLKSSSSVSIIHFKVIETSDNSVIYHVNYAVNSNTITSSDGIVLFKKDGENYFINAASEILLKSYLFEITTEDAQGNLSEVYSVIK